MSSRGLRAIREKSRNAGGVTALLGAMLVVMGGTRGVLGAGEEVVGVYSHTSELPENAQEVGQLASDGLQGWDIIGVAEVLSDQPIYVTNNRVCAFAEGLCVPLSVFTALFDACSYSRDSFGAAKSSLDERRRRSERCKW